jgi:hypothetical protein
VLVGPIRNRNRYGLNVIGSGRARVELRGRGGQVDVVLAPQGGQEDLAGQRGTTTANDRPGTVSRTGPGRARYGPQAVAGCAAHEGRR